MRKVISLLLALAFVVVVAGCSGDKQVMPSMLLKDTKELKPNTPKVLN